MCTNDILCVYYLYDVQPQTPKNNPYYLVNYCNISRP
jgi:hypothetical protein